MEKISQGNPGPNIDPETVDRFLDAVKYQIDVSGKRCLIVGSRRPWLAALLILYGAKHIVHLDDEKITSEHPKIAVMSQETFARRYLEGSLGLFDAMFSYRSLAAFGLGKFGDGLHPWADVVVMGKIWCVLKDGARIFVALPGAARDKFVYNSHRVYGPVMTSHLLSNFKVTDFSHPNFRNLSQTGLGKIHWFASAEKLPHVEVVKIARENTQNNITGLARIT